MTRFVLTGKEVLANLFIFLAQIDLDSYETLEVIIQVVNEKRRQKQRRLQYMWYTEISKSWGWSVKRVRNYYMEIYAVPMFYRDNINDSADTIDCIKNLKHQGMQMEYEQMKKHFIESITSSSFSVKQNSEYLTQIEGHAYSKGVHLTIPNDMQGVR